MRGQDNCAQCNSRPNIVRRRIESARSRSVDEPRRTHARRLLHCRCGGIAALDSRLTIARLCRRRHPRFDRAKAENFLAKTTIKRTSKVRELSKGMVAQLHLAIVMAIDARLLVLDEPTLGLDILYRKQFYDSLLNDYFDRSRTIIVTTSGGRGPGRFDGSHVHRPWPDRARVQHGRIRLALPRSDGESRAPRRRTRAQTNDERTVFGRSVLLFDRVDRAQLETMGEIRRPSIADLLLP